MSSKYFAKMGSLNPHKQEFFCCFHDTNKAEPARTFHQPFEQIKEQLRYYNNRGYGIFMAFNPTDSRKTYSSPRGVFIDIDKAGYEPPFPIEPHIKVNTSPGKHHYYFLQQLSSEYSEEDWRLWERIEHSLVKNYNGDPSVRDRARVLRVPGFYNMKDPAHPHLVTAEVMDHEPYPIHVLQQAFPPTRNPDGATPKNTQKKVHHKLLSATEAILSRENYNDSLCTLSMHFIDKQYPEDFIYHLLNGLLHLVPKEQRDKRWHERVDHLPRMISQGVDKKRNEMIPLKQKDTVFCDPSYVSTELPQPTTPYLRELTDAVYGTMRYPESNIALLGALHLIGTFAGRIFQIEGYSLSIKRVLLAEQGRGKNTISTCVKQAIGYMSQPSTTNIPRVMQAGEFHINGNITAPSALHELLEEFGSRSLILSEAGQAGKHQSGYKSDLKGYILQLLSEPNTVPVMPFVQRHKKMKIVYQRNLTLLAESVPDNYIGQLVNDQALIDGDIARSELIFANRQKPNPCEIKPLSPEVIEPLIRLASLNTPNPQGVMPLQEVIDIKLSPEASQAFLELEQRAVDIHNENTDQLLVTVYNRIALKAKITAALIHIGEYFKMISPLAGAQLGPDIAASMPPISKETALYAIKYQEAIVRTVIKIGKAGLFNSPMERALNAMEFAVFKVFKKYEKEATASSANITAPIKLENQWIERKHLWAFVVKDQVFKEYTKLVWKGNTKRAFEELVNLMIDLGTLRQLNPYKDGVKDKLKSSATYYMYLYDTNYLLKRYKADNFDSFVRLVKTSTMEKLNDEARLNQLKAKVESDSLE